MMLNKNKWSNKFFTNNTIITVNEFWGEGSDEIGIKFTNEISLGPFVLLSMFILREGGDHKVR